MEIKLDKSLLNIVKVFIEAWKESIPPKSSLFLNVSEHNIFQNVDFKDFHIVSSIAEINDDSKFDLIIGNIPFGIRLFDKELLQENIKVSRSWGEIIRSLRFLDENGTALYLFEPIYFTNSKGQDFKQVLNKIGRASCRERV
mgnify:CR=1 FL=1